MKNLYTVVVFGKSTKDGKIVRSVIGIYSQGTYLDTSHDNNHMVSIYVTQEKQKNKQL